MPGTGCRETSRFEPSTLRSFEESFLDWLRLRHRNRDRVAGTTAQARGNRGTSRSHWRSSPTTDGQNRSAADVPRHQRSDVSLSADALEDRLGVKGDRLSSAYRCW